MMASREGLNYSRGSFDLVRSDVRENPEDKSVMDPSLLEPEPSWITPRQSCLGMLHDSRQLLRNRCSRRHHVQNGSWHVLRALTGISAPSFWKQPNQQLEIFVTHTQNEHQCTEETEKSSKKVTKPKQMESPLMFCAHYAAPAVQLQRRAGCPRGFSCRARASIKTVFN